MVKFLKYFKKSFVVAFIFVISAFGAFSQQMPIFTQHTYSLMYSNPGYAGMGDAICVDGLMRQQWAGFEDDEGNKVAPNTYLISINSPVKFLHGGLGGSIIQDKLGFESNIALNLSYSFQIPLSFADLGMGVGANLLNKTIDFGKLKPSQGGDPLLTGINTGVMMFDADVGFFLKNPDYYAGFSVKNLLELKGKDLSTNSNTVIRFQTDRTFYLTGAYYIKTIPDFLISPSFMIMSDLAQTQLMIAGNFSYKNKFFGGISYRLFESIGIIAGVRIKDFKLTYSYDVVTIRYGMPGSHEIGLRYCFKIKGDNSKTSYKNTRFL